MYFEEKMINGIMHYRSNPKAEFEPYSIEELSHLYDEAKSKIRVLDRMLTEEVEG